MMRHGFFLIILFLAFAMPGYAENFDNVEWLSCYDGDTCKFNIPGLPPIFGERINVRVAGIDTPEIRGKCESEKAKAKEARDAARAPLKNAKHISLQHVERGKFFRIVASIIADGVSLGDVLITCELARSYDGGKREGWC